MSFLSLISLTHRKLVALLTTFVVAFGIYAALSLKQQLLPDLSFPAVTVVAAYPGAAPEVVEEQVTVPIEKAVQNLDGVENTSSTSQQGSVQVMVSFTFDTDIRQASTDIEQAVAKISAQLPQGVTPQVLTGTTRDIPTMVLAATSDTDQRKLAADLNARVVPALRAIDGVNNVSVSGVRGQIVTVTPNADALAKAGLSTQSIVGALSTLGGTASAGQITSDGHNLSLAVGAPVTTLQQIQDLWLSAATSGSSAASDGPGGPGASGSTSAAAGGAATASPAAPVQLKAVAAVALTDAPATSITRTDGQPSLGVSITMDHGGSSPAISDKVRAQLPALQAALGANAKLVVVSDNGPSVKNSVNGLVEEGALGLAMAILVIVVFLRSGRSTLVTAVSIPLSLLVALIAVWQRGYSLNILTLGALTIAIGRVVDDSIVVLENIKRHLGYGENRRSAVLSGVREVATAVTSSTLTTVAVFLPIALVSGFVGELFGSFSITVSVAMLASLVVSLTVVPVLAYWFLKAPKDAIGVPPAQYRARAEEQERHGLLPRTYRPVLTWALGHRKAVLAGAVALLIATAGLATFLKTTFIGDIGQASIRVTQSLPAGTALAAADTAAKRVEQALVGVNGVESYQVVLGSTGGFFDSATANGVSFTLNLADDADSDTVTGAVRGRLATITDAGKLTVGGDGGPGGSDSNVSVSIRADDDTALVEATRQVQAAMSTVSQVTDVRSDLSESVPQISIVPNGEAAARYGLTATAIVSALRQAIDGTTVTQVTLNGTPHDVTVQTNATAPDSLDKVKAITLATSSGPVRLDQVATVSLVDGPVQRTHIDGTRTNTVTATPVGDDTGAASTAVTDKLATLTLPAGASYLIGGVTEDQSEAFSQLILAMAAAIALVFLVLVAVFRSIRQTLILLVSIPFSFIGAFFLLLVTGTPLGVAALIGILMLIGIVVTNAIVLMDLVNQYREKGMSVTEAVFEGGQRRLRPILMTALATIFALLPMAFGITGEGGFISTPLAVVVIGGLITSTLLTLVLIPVLYTLSETRRERRQARKQGGTQPSQPAVEPVPAS